MDGEFDIKPLGVKPKSKLPANLKEAVAKALTEKTKRFIPHLLIGAFLVAGGFSVYFWNEARGFKNNPQKAAQEETRKLLADVSGLIILPEGEIPTIATVSDPEKLTDQPFFAKAQKGDKVLIYTNSRKAILYSPKENKIVEVAPINIGNPSKTSTQ